MEDTGPGSWILTAFWLVAGGVVLVVAAARFAWLANKRRWGE